MVWKNLLKPIYFVFERKQYIYLKHLVNLNIFSQAPTLFLLF